MNTIVPAISPVLRYDDAAAAVEWLKQAFGFEPHSDFRTPDGGVAHADLRFGTRTIGVSSARLSPPGSVWSTVRQGLYVQVDDADAYHARASAAGAEIVMPLTNTPYGSRDFTLRDPGGHLWGFGTYAMGSLAGAPTIWPELRYADPAAARTWLERAIGMTTTLALREGDAPDAPLRHVEQRLGSSVIMFGSEWPAAGEWASLSQVVHLRADDPDALFARVMAAGAKVLREPQTAPYGARLFSVSDREGFVWWASDYVPAA